MCKSHSKQVTVLEINQDFLDHWMFMDNVWGYRTLFWTVVHSPFCLESQASPVLWMLHQPFLQKRIKIQLTLGQHGFWTDCSGPLICGLFFNKSILQYYTIWDWLNLQVQNHGYRGPPVKLDTWIFTALWAVGWVGWSAPLTHALFRYQLYKWKGHLHIW